MRILTIDVGGTNIKLLATNQDKVRRIPSDPTLTAGQLVEKVKQATEDWNFDVISIGYPGPVLHGQVLPEPKNLGPGWVDFDFAGAFGKPVKVINDAAMQALGSYEGGRMLFIGLGTGMGSAMILDSVIAPLELAHLPYKKKRSFEDYVGLRGLERLGKKKWQRAVEDVLARLEAALMADYVVIGGGNAKKLERLPPGTRMGDNKNAFLGGYRLWQDFSAGQLQVQPARRGAGENPPNSKKRSKD